MLADESSSDSATKRERGRFLSSLVCHGSWASTADIELVARSWEKVLSHTCDDPASGREAHENGAGETVARPKTDKQLPS